MVSILILSGPAPPCVHWSHLHSPADQPAPSSGSGKPLSARHMPAYPPHAAGQYKFHPHILIHHTRQSSVIIEFLNALGQIYCEAVSLKIPY